MGRRRAHIGDCPSVIGAVVSEVVGFAGRIGTGKTAVARQVASRISCRWTSFSAFLRGEARTRGLDASRQVLQELGVEWIDQGWNRFCRAILDDVSWHQGESLVVDGVRHVKVVHALREILAPDPFVLVFLDPPEPDEWERRLRAKGIASLHELNQLEIHPAELEVMQVRDLADLILKTTQSVELIADEVVAVVRGTRGLH